MMHKRKIESPYGVSEEKMIPLEQGRKQIMQLVGLLDLTPKQKEFLTEMTKGLPDGPLLIRFRRTTIPALPFDQIVGKNGRLEQAMKETFSDVLHVACTIALAKLGRLGPDEFVLIPQKCGSLGYMTITFEKTGFLRRKKKPRVTFYQHPTVPTTGVTVLLGTVERHVIERVVEQKPVHRVHSLTHANAQLA